LTNPEAFQILTHNRIRHQVITVGRKRNILADHAIRESLQVAGPAAVVLGLQILVSSRSLGSVAGDMYSKHLCTGTDGLLRKDTDWLEGESNIVVDELGGRIEDGFIVGQIKGAVST